MHQQHLQRVVDGDAGADLEAHLGRLLRRRVARHRQQGVEAEATIPDGAQRGVGRHQFGDGGRIPRKRSVLGVQHFAGRCLDQELGFGMGADGGRERERQRGKADQ